MHGFAVIKYVVVRTHGLKIQMGSDLCYPARKIRLRFGAGGFFSFRPKRSNRQLTDFVRIFIKKVLVFTFYYGIII